ncbi:olfactory receptor 14A16-like [Tiliqua scincoides]|uniref:olfactory receptor 14A16-like n=1 Tax=Tiliqua scincoides TaxID=71010 RepID=UPI0034637157
MFLSNDSKMDNKTHISEFMLLDFSEILELPVLYFLLFLVLYLLAISGNLLIISAVALDHHLHTPMYFFLMNLAMFDLASISVIIPKSMANFLMNTRRISYSGCMAQILFFVFFVGSDFFLLTVMAYDRYAAICNPLQYEIVMNRQACLQMVASVWIIGLFYGVIHASGTFAGPFCFNNVNQFYCDIPNLLKLLCSDWYLVELGVLISSISIVFGCFIFVIVTYVQIFSAVLRIPSVQGRQKAFSTCLPHLGVFSTFVFGGCIAYLRPTSNTPSALDVAFTVIYSTAPPILNPVIYSMRNKDIKVALSKILGLKNNSKNAFSTLLQ